MKLNNGPKLKATPEARVRAVFSLYPWLEPQLKDLKPQIKQVHLHKVSHAILTKSAYAHSEEFEKFHHDARIYLYTKEGELIDHVGVIYGKGTGRTNASETVEEAINRVIKKGHEVHYIAGTLHDEESPWSLHIAFPPDGRTLMQTLGDELKLATEELEQEIKK